MENACSYKSDLVSAQSIGESYTVCQACLSSLISRDIKFEALYILYTTNFEKKVHHTQVLAGLERSWHTLFENFGNQC